MGLVALICPYCGGKLVSKGDHYECPFCENEVRYFHEEPCGKTEFANGKGGKGHSFSLTITTKETKEQFSNIDDATLITEYRKRTSMADKSPIILYLQINGVKIPLIEHLENVGKGSISISFDGNSFVATCDKSITATINNEPCKSYIRFSENDVLRIGSASFLFKRSSTL